MIAERLRAGGGLATALTEDQLAVIVDLAEERAFTQGEYLFRQDTRAGEFFVIEHGRASIELAPPARPPIVLQTLSRGDLVGLSWWFPGSVWKWDARAVTDVATFAFDADAVRAACARDIVLRQAFAEFIASEFAVRLHRARLQLLDMYGVPES